MDKRQEIESIASRYDLDVDFVQQLHDKVTDKENFARAVKMFVDGTLPFAVATGDVPINVASIRHDVAVNLLELRKMRADKVKEQMEMQRRIVEYYNGCRQVTMTHKGNKSIRERYSSRMENLSQGAVSVLVSVFRWMLIQSSKASESWLNHTSILGNNNRAVHAAHNFATIWQLKSKYIGIEAVIKYKYSQDIELNKLK